MKIMTFLLLSLTLLACEPDVPKPPGLPSNLNTQLTVTNGEVTVLATADSVNFFTICSSHSTFVKQLQKDIKDIRMSFFNFIKQKNWMGILAQVIN